MTVRVKICGITNEQDAEFVVASGADLVGINLIPTSKRYVSVETARRLVQVIAGRAEVIAVVADLSVLEANALRAASGVDGLQHHGAEPPELLAQLPSCDFKAVRIADASDVVLARSYRGPRLLLDAKVSGALGGTGQRFDWSLVGALVQERQVLLAGGLLPENVAEAIRQVRPWAVDVASGVESSPGHKDPKKVVRFVTEAHNAGT